MQDIPMFTTENGVASLTLKEIPYCADAYVHILDCAKPDPFIKECASFCRMAGAESVYLSGKKIPDKYPIFTEIWKMQCPRSKLLETDAFALAVDASSKDDWREIYNSRMSDIPTAAFMSNTRLEHLLNYASAYFVYRNNTLLGIGAGSEQRIDCIASVLPGAGKDVMCALAKSLSGDLVLLEVASENKRAVAFYERLGFIKTDVKEIWHQFIPENT